MIPTRIRVAAAAADAVVATGGVLARFNDAGVLGAVDVLAAQTMARVWGEADEDVLLAAALAVRGTRHGHVCLRLEAIDRSVVVEGDDGEDLSRLPWPDAGVWLQTLAGSSMVGDGNGPEPLILHNDLLYLEKFYRYEVRVAHLLHARATARHEQALASGDEILEALLGAPLPEPTTQRRAAAMAVSSPLTVIAGGPGTGKTHTVAAMLGALAGGSAPFPSVALSAPTGKAAARLGEAVRGVVDSLGDADAMARVAGVEAVTLHRLLGWLPGRNRYRHDASHPIPHDMVVVDEVSMVSLPMAARLLEAVRPEAALVLVGDPFQLEAIEAGTVLADIVSTAGSGEGVGSRVVVLDRTRRYEGAIADFADAVRSGDTEAAMSVLAGGHDDLRWIPDRAATGFGELWAGIVDQRSRLVELATAGDAEGAYAALVEMAVLCARRRGPESVLTWGKQIEMALDERFTGLRYKGEWYRGRPIMITRNDPTLGLYNGDIGVVVDGPDGLRAAFEGGRLVALSHLGEHVTFHASTIHKSQGSQFEEVAVVLPSQESRLLTRQLLYTAVTRATRRVWVVGPEPVVRHAISRVVERASGLAKALSP